MTSDRNSQRAGKLDTATLSDALDRLGIRGQCRRIMPREPGFAMSGRAYTLLYGPAGHSPGTVGDYIDDIAEGSIIALDNRGRTDVTVWGDILTEIAHRRGLAGTAINGINRDVALCRELGYPVFSIANWMRTGKDRVQVEAAQVPIDLGGVRVAPGDLLRGDADGLVALPRELEDKILAVAEEIHEAEEQIRVAVRDGLRLDEARAKFKYHQLQSRRED